MYDYYPDSWGSLSHEDARNEMAERASRTQAREQLQVYFEGTAEVEVDEVAQTPELVDVS